MYALKILDKAEIGSKKADVDSMKAERNILTMMNHPFIVSLHGAFQTKTKLYLLMDYICGGELFHHINKQGIFMEEQVRKTKGLLEGCTLVFCDPQSTS